METLKPWYTNELAEAVPYILGALSTAFVTNTEITVMLAGRFNFTMPQLQNSLNDEWYALLYGCKYLPKKEAFACKLLVTSATKGMFSITRI